MKFCVGQVAYHLWDQDAVLLLRHVDAVEAGEHGFSGDAIDVGLFTCWHVLGLLSGNDWFVLDCDLED